MPETFIKKNRKMFGITKIIATLTFFNIAHCDLIGYNRLRNNVNSHIRHHRHADGVPNYRIQLISNLLKANQEVSISDIDTLSKMMKRNRKVKNNRRFRHYNRMMHNM